jgi:phosphatidylinositol alpha-1,6-mannosyltransferase
MQKEIKKALVLTVDFPPMGGGMARHCLDVCEALKNTGFEPAVAAPASGRDGAGTVAGFRIQRLGSVRPGRIFDNYIASVLAYYFAAIKFCLFGKPALVLANTWSVAGVAALMVKKTAGIPYAVFAHGLDVYSSRTSPKVQRLMAAVLGNAAAVIANSNFTKDLVRRQVPGVNAVVLNPMVDPGRLSAPEAPRGPGGGARKREILTVARLVESKAHETVIRALPKILAAFPDATYRIVGTGPREGALRAVAAECGVSGNVIFQGGAGEEELAGFYRDCGVFVMTSREIPERGEVEGFGIVFLEAGASGKPVVGSRSGGIPDSVEDGVTGILVGENDPEGTAAAVIKLFSDHDLADRMGQAGKLRAEKGFGPAVFSGRLKKIIDGITGR